jgi:hypothetical protein
VGRLAELSRFVLGVPVELPDDLRTQYPELSVATFRQGGIPPRFAGWLLGQRSVAAITLWRTIFLGEGIRPAADLLLHELRHVEQFSTRKSFPLHYIWQSLRYGYNDNCYEVDARDYASRRLAEAGSPRTAKEGT